MQSQQPDEPCVRPDVVAAAEAPLEVSRWGVGGVASEQSKQQSAAFEGTLGGLSSKALEEHSRWSVRDGDGRHRVEHGDGLLKALMTSLQDEDTAAVYLIVSQNAPCPRQVRRLHANASCCWDVRR